jgi:two-component system, chemotaxis family, chemotaxis protein CheY
MGSPLSTLNVLIVDDQRTMRSIMRNLLQLIGIRNIGEAANGAEALDLLASQRGDEATDLIICDLMMDKMDGLEFCNSVRRAEHLRKRQIPILLLTAEQDQFVLGVAAQVGAAAIAHKPISAPDLKAMIERLVGFRSNGPSVRAH